MRDLRAEDPAVTILAWEAVEELLGGVPECRAKDVLRMVAAGVRREEIAHRLGVGVDAIDMLVERGRALVITAAQTQEGATGGRNQLRPG